MEKIPFYVYGIFIFTTFLTFLFLYFAGKRSNLLAGIVFTWLLAQSFVSYSGFYLITESYPPRFLLLVMPPLVVVILLFLTRPGRRSIDRFEVKALSYLHVVRLPVEVVLWLLYQNKLVPELMTFEGRNFDIVTGISAPFIAYFGYSSFGPKRTQLLIWNFISLGLLINIVVNAVLSAPFPFQQFAFDQPNVGVLYFPFVWLPGFIVPVALFSHLVCIRALILRK